MFMKKPQKGHCSEQNPMISRFDHEPTHRNSHPAVLNVFYFACLVVVLVASGFAIAGAIARQRGRDAGRKKLEERVAAKAEA